MPGMRSLQKYAVRVGGGHNHRFGLYDAVMLKDNHHAVVGGLNEAIHRVKSRVGHMVKIEVECETLDQVNEALECGVDVIMLDNMSTEDMKTAVKVINHRLLSKHQEEFVRIIFGKLRKQGRYSFSWKTYPFRRSS